MKLRYYPDTDSLYIDLVDKDSVESIEMSENIILDVDEQGQPVGIDIQNASKSVDLGNFEMSIPRLMQSA